MARRIGQDLMVELSWETLLGVDKERREIRDLCARRGTDHYVVFDDDVGLRTAGLVTGQGPRGEPDADAAPAWTLAGILAGRSDGRPLVFLHALDDAAEETLLIAVKAGRPEIDRVLPLPDALREAERFIETLDGECRLCGTHAPPGKSATPMPLPDGPSLSDKERGAYRIARLPTGFTRRAPTRRTRRRVTLAALAVVVGGAGAGVTGLRGRRADAPPAVTPPDPLAEHRERLARAMARELAAPGPAHATRMVALLGQLPVEAAQWRMSRMRCAGDGCEILWRRRPGGTLDGLLDARPAAVPSEEDIDQAMERIALPDDPAPARALAPRRRDVFYRIANSRAQRLRDAGLAMELGPTRPVVASASGTAPPPATPLSTTPSSAPEKGAWTMSGHLAFVDSVPGLLGRTGNMSVRELLVEIDPVPSRFRAAGDFYVE